MAEFYSARGWEIPPLPWTNLSPPFSEDTTTIVIEPGWRAELHESGSFVLTRTET